MPLDGSLAVHVLYLQLLRLFDPSCLSACVYPVRFELAGPRRTAPELPPRLNAELAAPAGRRASTATL